ncbi:MAG: hypothetical protein JJU00_04480 [Opitutales bacterium]|nr:hypothetical protein [Opitutales bacterium]
MNDELQITLTGDTARAVRIAADLLNAEPGEIAAALIDNGDLERAAHGDARDFADFCERFALSETEAREVAARAGQYFERRFTVRPHHFGPSFTVGPAAERGHG